MYTVDDVARRNFLANLGNLLIQFQIEQNKKAEAGSQAAKPEKPATAETLAEDPQAKEESTTKTDNVKNLADKIEKDIAVRLEQSDYQATPGVADANT